MTSRLTQIPDLYNADTFRNIMRDIEARFLHLESRVSGLAVASTWTPTLLGDGTAGTPTYVSQLGDYLNVMDHIIASFRIAISLKGGMVGNLRVGGIPFACDPAGPATFAGWGSLNNATGLTHQAGYTEWVLSAVLGATELNIREIGSGLASAAQLVTNTADNSTIAGLFIYRPATA